MSIDEIFNWLSSLNPLFACGILVIGIVLIFVFLAIAGTVQTISILLYPMKMVGGILFSFPFFDDVIERLQKRGKQNLTPTIEKELDEK